MTMAVAGSHGVEGAGKASKVPRASARSPSRIIPGSMALITRESGGIALAALTTMQQEKRSRVLGQKARAAAIAR